MFGWLFGDNMRTAIELTKFKQCPNCHAGGWFHNVNIYRCHSCGRRCCDDCMTGAWNKYCPNCTAQINETRDHYGYT